MNAQNSFRLVVLVVSALLPACARFDGPDSRDYPIGLVIGPGGSSSRPSEEEQKFHYQWAARLGFNIIESEVLGVANGYLNWGNAQPEPDRFYWKAYDGTVRDAQEAGMDVMLELATWRSPPGWVFERYPDSYFQTPLAGADELTPVKYDPKLDIPSLVSLAHPQVLEAAERFAKKIAARYRDREAVRGYIIGEESGLCGVWPFLNYYGIDFSPAMARAYHEHLERRFGTVTKLNTVWGCPGRYERFDQVRWRRGWAYDPDSYRGEWLEYYRCLQQVFARFHNRVAQAIHAADPDAIVMVSEFQTLQNRVGHGSWLPLMDQIDAVAYKSFYDDQRALVDFCRGISGGKDVWCSNLSERETTSGPVEEQRYLEARYVRRQFWPAFARGLKGTFLWLWARRLEDGVQKMNVLEPLEDGSMEPIHAVSEAAKLRQFLREWWPRLKAFELEAPRVVIHDPNWTYITEFWQYADPKKVRANWETDTPAAQGYRTMINLLAQYNRRFTVSTDQTLGSMLDGTDVDILCLTGSNVLSRKVASRIEQWVEEGGRVILDERSGRREPMGQPLDAFSALEGRANVLLLDGDRWDEDLKQHGRVREFLSQHLPQRYGPAHDQALPEDAFTVDILQSDNGDELAIVSRRTTVGRLEDRLEFFVRFHRSHRRLTMLDPSATPERWARRAGWLGGVKQKFVLEGYQDVLLILAEN